MSFVVCALLSDGAPELTSDTLAEMARNYLKAEENFTIEFSQLPFHVHRSVDLRWNGWFSSLTYEEGDEVEQQSVEINRILGTLAPYDLSKIRRRIHVFFDDDEEMEYTNEVILIWQFLDNIPGVILFDPQQRNLIEFSE